MKKILAILMALSVMLGCLSLASCGETPDADATTTGGGPSQSEKPTEPTKNTEPTGNNENNQTVSPVLEAALSLLESVKSVTEVNDENYSSVKSKYESANEGYEGLSDDEKNSYGEANKQILENIAALIKAYENSVKSDPLKYYQLQHSMLPTIQTSKGTVAVDGKLEATILDNCTSMMLNKEKCNEWNSQNREDGAGMVGDTSLSVGADTEVEFFFMYDDDNLYIIERRSDLTWNFTAKTYSQAYTGDGSIVWFVNIADAEGWAADGIVDNGDEPECGLMWNAGLNGEEPGENSHQIAYFPYDDQSAPVKKTTIDGWQSALGWDEGEKSYVLEVAIPWSDLPFSAQDIEAGNIAATFCTVDIVDSSFDGDKTKLWSGMGYQMQYPGVNNWCWSQSLVVKK